MFVVRAICTQCSADTRREESKLRRRAPSNNTRGLRAGLGQMNGGISHVSEGTAATYADIHMTFSGVGLTAKAGTAGRRKPFGTHSPVLRRLIPDSLQLRITL